MSFFRAIVNTIVETILRNSPLLLLFLAAYTYSNDIPEIVVTADLVTRFVHAAGPAAAALGYV